MAFSFTEAHKEEALRPMQDAQEFTNNGFDREQQLDQAKILENMRALQVEKTKKSRRNNGFDFKQEDETEDTDSKNKTVGRWTREEHERFIEGIVLFGRNWKKVESHVGTRNGAQIRSHAQKYFNRLQKEFKAEDPVDFIMKSHTGSSTAPKENLTETPTKHYTPPTSSSVNSDDEQKQKSRRMSEVETEYQRLVEEKNMIMQKDVQSLCDNPSSMKSLEYRVINLTKDLQKVLQGIPTDTQNSKNILRNIVELKSIASNLKQLQDPPTQNDDPQQLANCPLLKLNNSKYHKMLDKKAKLFDLVDLESPSAKNDEQIKHKTCFDMGGFSPVSVTEKCFSGIQRLREQKNLSSFSGFVNSSNGENSSRKHSNSE